MTAWAVCVSPSTLCWPIRPVETKGAYPIYRWAKGSSNYYPAAVITTTIMATVCGLPPLPQYPAKHITPPILVRLLTSRNVCGEGEGREPWRQHDCFTHKINEAERG